MRDQLQLWDTLTRDIKPVQALDGQTVRFYCCGPTVYGPAHIGNFRTFVTQDLLRRTLELSGQPTLHVRNITDVDDKTIRQSRAEGKSLKEFTDFWLKQFRDDCATLQLLPPHVEPGAVEHITQQIALIERLTGKNHAYRTEDGSVYFRIDSFPEYGRLSRVKERELSTGAGGRANQADEYERESVADFALWKARKAEDGDNYWCAPWGEGRPGWHLECSCMSMQYLGESFDLHGGGVDLIFPHHENEIAQSEAATGRPFVAHWFHTAHLLVDGRKMSKSDGNLYTLADLQQRGYSAMELRYVLLSGKYGQPLNFTFDSLNAARQALRKLAGMAGEIDFPVNGPDYTAFKETIRDISPQNPLQKAWEALLEDLNVSEALGQTFIALKELSANSGKLSKEERVQAQMGLQRILHALGIVLPNPTGDGPVVPEEVGALAERRWQAKNSKDWKTADVLRQELANRGWTMQDGKDNYKLFPKV